MPTTTRIEETNAVIAEPSAPLPAQTSRRPLPRWALGLIVHLAVTVGQLLVWFAGRCGAARRFRLSRWITLKLEPLTRRRRQSNLRLFFGSTRTSDQLAAIDEAHLNYLARMRSEVAGYYNAAPERLIRDIDLKGEEYLRETLALKRGALLVSGHTATWWTAPAALAARGYPVTAIFTPIQIRRVERKLLAFTRRFNVKLAFVGRDAYLAARNAIERNEILYLTFDVAVRANRARTFPFGDSWLQMDPGPAILAVRNRMPTLQAACVHVEAGRNSVSIYSPQSLESIPQSATPEDICRLWTGRLENEVRLHPDQWWPWGYVNLSQQSTPANTARPGSQR